MIIINIVQVSKNRWKLETQDQVLILDDIMLYSIREAEDYAKAYISTWASWDFNVIPMEEK